jgi:hypothetical protein
MKTLSSILTLVLIALAGSANAQNFRDFHNHNTELKALQPNWVGPLVTTNPLISQNFREQFTRQRIPGGDSVWNIGNGKGPALILSSRVETDFAVPNYVVHGASSGTDGVGDFGLTTKYRIASGNRDHGNYIVSAVANQTWSTGLVKNGAISWTRSITLAGGKTLGNISVLSSLGAVIPATSGLASIGHPITWNSAFEIHVSPKLWAQLESNSTFYSGGTHDGKKQNFVTPGVLVSPLKPWGESSKSSLMFGAGMQFATTRYHATDHNLIVDTKFVF